MGYRSIIMTDHYPVPKEDGTNDYKTVYLQLDYQKPKEVSATSNIVQQPLISGDVMSDHMYRNPKTITISGKFGLNGKYRNDNIYTNLENKNGDRLSAVQTVFETINEKGVLCDIVTMETDDSNEFDNSKTRFLARRNMALTSISWTEYQDTLDYNFTFTEVIMVNDIEFDIDFSDDQNPDLQEPDVCGLGTLLADNAEFERIVLEALYKSKYINDESLIWLTTAGRISGLFLVAAAATVFCAKIGLTASVIGAVVGTAVKVATLGLVTLSSGACIVVGAAIAVVAVVYGIVQILNWRKKKLRASKVFKLLNKNGSVNDKEVIRLSDMFKNIKTKLDTTLNGIGFYKLENNGAQKVAIQVDGGTYVMEFTKLATYPYWHVSYSGYKGDYLNGELPSSNIINNFACGETIFNTPDELALFKTFGSDYYVYILYPSLAVTDESGQRINRSVEQIESIITDLSQAVICVAYKGLSKQVKAMEKTIRKCVENS